MPCSQIITQVQSLFYRINKYHGWLKSKELQSYIYRSATTIKPSAYVLRAFHMPTRQLWPVDRTCSTAWCKYSTALGSGEFGRAVGTFSFLSSSPSHSWVSFCGVAGHTVLNLNECQDPRFHSRTLHCNNMINVIYFTCQWFRTVVWGWSVHIVNMFSTSTACST